MSDRAAGIIEHWYKRKSQKKDYTVGIITVVHTFGQDMKFNPHIHALVTEGALDKFNVWKPVSYIPYEYLRKANVNTLQISDITHITHITHITR